MPIPDYQSVMLPLLKHAADGNDHNMPESLESLAQYFNLTPEEQEELFPSGYHKIFVNRVYWAKTHISKAGLLESPRRAVFRITEKGKQVIKNNPPIINVQFLKQYLEYLEFIKPSTGTSNHEPSSAIETSLSTPVEILENSYQSLRKTLAQDLLVKIKQSTPTFFERLVVELLVKMGYGGSLKDAGKATKPTNDEGIDGIIKEDKLGLDVIYIQAKRWGSQAVGRPDIQSFVGALDGQRANKGIFITTSRFADNAVQYVKTISKKVILIDGEQLATYMIDYNLAVSPVAT